MIRLDVLAIGSLIRDGTAIKEAHSTSTLIRTGERSIVVDTSSEYMLPMIKESLKQLRVLPKDVDTIVLTHSHHDHASNNGLFRKAKIYVRKEEKCDGDIIVKNDTELCDGIRLVHTPGHTDGSMSVFVASDVRYVMAGDAVPLEDNFRRMVPPRIHTDAGLAVESIKAITSYADMVVPGHGLPFKK